MNVSECSLECRALQNVSILDDFLENGFQQSCRLSPLEDPRAMPCCLLDSFLMHSNKQMLTVLGASWKGNSLRNVETSKFHQSAEN